MTEIKTVDVEIIKDDKIVKFAANTGLETTAAANLVDAFRPIFSKARAALADAKGVAESVKDATCVREIRKSRECRLTIRSIRIESEKVRKKQKEHALAYGKAVDGFHNILLADLSPVETALQEAEDTAERAEQARLGALKAAREAELQPLMDTPIVGDLSDISDKDFQQLVSDAKLLRQAKLDAAKAAAEAAAKAAAEAASKAEADRIERERIDAENARLKAEAEALESAARAEREAAAKKLAEEHAKAEAAAKAQREAAEKQLAAERAAAEAAAKAAAEQARKEREAVEAKARAERAAAEAAAKKEQERLKAVAEQHRKEHAAAVAREQAQRDAEAKQQAYAAAAAKKAAAAPDNAKAQAFADSLRKLPLPSFTGKSWSLLPSKVEALAEWVEDQTSTGELL